MYLVGRSIGTVLGFVISYRTTSSFERYNEGRKYWSQIVYATRTIARLIWFHVPGTLLTLMPLDTI
jgi:ion channel-forming bestrophin family protein